MRVFDISENVRGVGVVLRASLNVPIQNGTVTNTFRIDAALSTIEHLSRAGARTVVVAHIGREPHASLKPVFAVLKEKTTVPVSFAEACVGEATSRAVEALQPGEVLLVENLRRNSGETANDEAFAETLAGYGSLYINDAFPASHRTHASIVGIPQHIPGFAGPAFMREHDGITPALTPVSPSIAIIGGAKFITKEPLMRTLLETYDRVFIGGALANDFFLAQGHEVGTSLVSRSAHAAELLSHPNLMLPTDVVVRGVDGVETKSVADVSPTDTIFDVGPESCAALAPLIERAAVVLWNGPLGNFEQGFSEGTERTARMVAQARGQSIVGGGDTVAAIDVLGLNKQFTHVSTAGGAMLDFIARGTLVGIEALGS